MQKWVPKARYDPAGQLTAANRGAPGGLDDYTWAYDASGNRVTQTQGPFVTTSSYNAANQLTSSRLNTFTPTTYAYDAAGRRTNTTQGANTVSYAYDAAGRLATRSTSTRWWIFSSTWSEHYAYDGEGRLAGLDVTSPANVSTGYELGWDTTSGVPQLLSIDDGGGADAFAYGANRIGVERADGSTGVFSYDPFGSAVRNPDTAEVVRADAYSPFGQHANSAFNDPLAHTPAFGYRGELTLDNTIHLRARTYMPAEGIFTTRDPLDGVAGTPTVTSPYHYTANDPINSVDPTGMRPGDGGFGSSSIACRVVPEFALEPDPGMGPRPTREQYLAVYPSGITCDGPGSGDLSQDPAHTGIPVAPLPRDPDGDDCDILRDCLMTRIADLAKRYGAIVDNPLDLPLKGPHMTVESHQNHYNKQKRDLQRALRYATQHNCLDDYPELGPWSTWQSDGFRHRPPSPSRLRSQPQPIHRLLRACRTSK